MFTEIRKPKLLKHMPMLIIRSLPAVYYYYRYINRQGPEQRARKLQQTNLLYLNALLKKIGQDLVNADFLNLSDEMKPFIGPHSRTEAADFTHYVERLSLYCEKNAANLRKYTRENRDVLRDLYRGMVKILSILILDNSGEPKHAGIIANNLQHFCHYNCETLSTDSPQMVDRVSASDFVLLGSTISTRIHEDVKILQSYKKPGLAITHLDKKSDKNTQAVRHGSQLHKTGFPVLFKLFSPLRLFTSIDKEYMRFHLC